MGSPLVVISAKVSIIGPLDDQITLIKSFVWSMKVFSKIVLTHPYKYYYLKLGLLLFLTLVLVSHSVECNGSMSILKVYLLKTSLKFQR